VVLRNVGKVCPLRDVERTVCPLRGKGRRVCPLRGVGRESVEKLRGKKAVRQMEKKVGVKAVNVWVKGAEWSAEKVRQVEGKKVVVEGRKRLVDIPVKRSLAMKESMLFNRVPHSNSVQRNSIQRKV
jgi:hypothetical protein